MGFQVGFHIWKRPSAKFDLSAIGGGGKWSESKELTDREISRVRVSVFTVKRDFRKGN